MDYIVGLFTYTPIILSAIIKDISFWDVYAGAQSRFVAFLVNVGLVLMVFFDFHVSRKTAHNYFIWSMLIGILFSMIIYGHCRLTETEILDKFIFPFDWKGLSLIFHVLFLFILVFLKERTLETDLNVAKRFENKLK